MLFGYRRYFAAAVFLLLATPLAWGLMWQDDPQLIYREGRKLAPVPDPPGSLAGLADLPGQVDAYLNDHFGLRHAMIKLHRDLSHPVVMKVNTAAMVGRDGRMFYEGNDMVRQSAGLMLRDKRLADAADLVAEMRDALAKRGARLLVTIPPNSSTVYQDELPLWAQAQGRKTEYDLFLEDLAARGVKTIDLRPAMEDLRSREKAYLLYDTHWTPRAAVEAFNVIVEADGHPDWRIDPATAIGPPEMEKGGDTARILDMEDQVSELVGPLVLRASGTDEILSPDGLPGILDRAITTGRPGPTIMVLGDSFTGKLFPPMLAQHVGRVVWVNRRLCGFDWKVVERFQPDEIWWAPTERLMLCEPGSRPIDFNG